MIEIDGSRGGGQLLRTSLALSSVLGKPFIMKNIRGNRDSPGLKTQHLKAVDSVADLCDADVEGNSMGSRRIKFDPGNISSGSLDVDIETAGSVGLLFQALQLPASCTEEVMNIDVNGGATFGKWAPTLPYVKKVFLPVVEKTGYNAQIKIDRHGFYPKGGAKVSFKIRNIYEFEPVDILERGGLKEIRGVSIASEHLRDAKVAKRQAESAERMLEDKGYSSDIDYRYVNADNPGSGITLWAKFENTVIGSDSVGEKGKRSEKVGNEASDELLRSLESNAPLDKYMADHILPCLALASRKGRSRINVEEVTDHCETNMWIIEKFMDVNFEIKGNVISVD